MRRARIIGTGAYLPTRVVTNHELAETLDTSDQWIVERTGIRQRHIAAEDECSSDLGVAAAKKLFAEHDIDPQRHEGRAELVRRELDPPRRDGFSPFFTDGWVKPTSSFLSCSTFLVLRGL